MVAGVVDHLGMQVRVPRAPAAPHSAATIMGRVFQGFTKYIKRAEMQGVVLEKKPWKLSVTGTVLRSSTRPCRGLAITASAAERLEGT
jgi:hypothetical protein